MGPRRSWGGCWHIASSLRSNGVALDTKLLSASVRRAAGFYEYTAQFSSSYPIIAVLTRADGANLPAMPGTMKKNSTEHRQKTHDLLQPKLDQAAFRAVRNSIAARLPSKPVTSPVSIDNELQVPALA